MKYYSEITKHFYNKEADLITDEKNYKAKLEAAEAKKKADAEARATRAKEVEEAYKASIDAQNHYLELRNKFVNDYGSFHMTFSSQTNPSFNSLFDFFFSEM